MGIPSYNAEQLREPHEQRVWRIVAYSPLETLWTLEGFTLKLMAARVGKALVNDRVFGRAAELGFYFFFSLFPALFCIASVFGAVARSAHRIYDELLVHFALVIPQYAMSTVMHTFNQIAAHASSGKITFGLLGAVWSASVGISAIQDTLNDVYKIPNTRSYLGARLRAIGLTFLVMGIVSGALTSMFGGDLVVRAVEIHVPDRVFGLLAALTVRLVAWLLAAFLLTLVFAVVYYWAPDWRKRRWRWITPGGAIGIAGWLLASLALRVYLYFFNNYSVTYGSLGAVIILLTWFYITGFTLLLGGEINSEIEASAVEWRMRTARTRRFAGSTAA